MTISIEFYAILSSMLFKKTKYSVVFKAISIVLLQAFFVSNFALATQIPTDSTLAPPLRTAPCELIDNGDGTYSVRTYNESIDAWNEERYKVERREAIQENRKGRILGKSLHEAWAFVDIGMLIGQMLKITEEKKLKHPKDLLIPLIKEHIKNRDGWPQIRLEGYDVDNLEEVRNAEGEVVAFELPVIRKNGIPVKMTYSLTGPAITKIPIRDTENKETLYTVYVVAKEFDEKDKAAELLIRGERTGTQEAPLLKDNLLDILPNNEKQRIERAVKFIEHIIKLGNLDINHEPHSTIELIRLKNTNPAALSFDNIPSDEIFKFVLALKLKMADFSNFNRSWADDTTMFLNDNHQLWKQVKLTPQDTFRILSEAKKRDVPLDSIFESCCKDVDELIEIIFTDRKFGVRKKLNQAFECIDVWGLKNQWTLTAGALDRIALYIQDKGNPHKAMLAQRFLKMFLKHLFKSPLKNAYMFNRSIVQGFLSSPYAEKHNVGVLYLLSGCTYLYEQAKQISQATGCDSSRIHALYLNRRISMLDRDAIRQYILESGIAKYDTIVIVDTGLVGHMPRFLNDILSEMPDYTKKTIHGRMLYQTNERYSHGKMDVIGWNQLLAANRDAKASWEPLYAFDSLDDILPRAYKSPIQLSKDTVLGKMTPLLENTDIPIAAAVVKNAIQEETKQLLAQNTVYPEALKYVLHPAWEVWLPGQARQNIIYGWKKPTPKPASGESKKTSTLSAEELQKVSLATKLTRDILEKYKAVNCGWAYTCQMHSLLLVHILSLMGFEAKVAFSGGHYFVILTKTDYRLDAFPGGCPVVKYRNLGYIIAKPGSDIFNNYYGYVQPLPKSSKYYQLLEEEGHISQADEFFNNHYQEIKDRIGKAWIVVEPTIPASERAQVTELERAIEAVIYDRVMQERAYKDTDKELQTTMVALSKTWVKEVLKGHPQSMDINELIIQLRQLCEANDIPFVDKEDDTLLGSITERIRQDGIKNPKVIVLAGQDTLKKREYKALRDKKNYFLFGINRENMVVNNYIRLVEMITLALNITTHGEPKNSTCIKIEGEGRFHIFTPPAEPMDWEKLRPIYAAQVSA